MSKPYFKINSVTYSGGILTMNYDLGRTRGSVDGNNTIRIDGFSGSYTFTENQRYASGEVATISISALGTSSTAAYTDPSSIVWTFAGAPSTNSNARLTLGSTQLSSVTSSNTVLTNFISDIATSIVNNSKGVAAATTSTTYVILPVQMRVNPTSVGFANLCISDLVNYNLAVSTLAGGQITTRVVSLDATHTTGATANRPAFLRANNSAAGYLEVSAEL
jgi:hypothetical protein